MTCFALKEKVTGHETVDAASAVLLKSKFLTLVEFIRGVLKKWDQHTVDS